MRKVQPCRKSMLLAGSQEADAAEKWLPLPEAQTMCHYAMLANMKTKDESTKKQRINEDASTKPFKRFAQSHRREEYDIV